MGIYTKADFQIGGASSVLQCNRTFDKKVAVKPPLPGTIIVIHGVNDVGVGFSEVEKGLCAGLGTRLGWGDLYKPAEYSTPKGDAPNHLEADPDAVFFKRHANRDTYSPVIPFYWGFREADGAYVPGNKTKHGQAVDRFGNRLDKDLSKGGGPFANATSTLVDMWNKGFGSGPYNVADKAGHDPLRPVLNAPGRMYMILAAQRLMALVAMIRDYQPNETVSLVGHSQGCLISLLAQAFLLEKGLRPADTLVLTHPPYSLVDDIASTSLAASVAGIGDWFTGGVDEAMTPHYAAIGTRQTMDARLRTLANIVTGVASHKHATPDIHTLRSPYYKGVVSAEWVADKPERDNRGKVYLYFCPEDNTVSLDTIQGIGWQGVPDFAMGLKLTPVRAQDALDFSLEQFQPQLEEREALKELGPSFFQRVFTARPRPPSSGKGKAKRVLIGADSPHDFALLLEGEIEHGHLAEGAARFRASSPAISLAVATTYLRILPKSKSAQRFGIRTITGECLKTPVKADMYSGGLELYDGGIDGAHEQVDPIDAAISVTSDYGLNEKPEVMMDDPRDPKFHQSHLNTSLNSEERQSIEDALNNGKPPEE